MAEGPTAKKEGVAVALRMDDATMVEVVRRRMVQIKAIAFLS